MQPTSLRLSTHTPLQLGHSPSSKPSLWQIPQFFLLALLLWAGSVQAQTIRYVKQTATGTGDGSSWANASADLQAMIDYVAANGTGSKEVWVAAGTYKPTQDPFGSATPTNNRDKTFYVKDGVKIYGGFSATAPEATLAARSITTNVTTLSGDFNGDDVVSGSGTTLSITNNSENAYHVVLASAASTGGVGVTVDGFTIKGGNANSSSSTITVSGNDIASRYGGGIYTRGGTNTLSNNTLSGNTAGDGGGIYTHSGTNTLSNNTLSGNTAISGGGIYIFSGNNTLSNNTLSGNSAGSGGGIRLNRSTNTLSNNTFLGNTAGSDGGGIYTQSGTNTLNNNIFWANTKGTTPSATIAGADYLNYTSNGNTFKNNLLQLASSNYPVSATGVYAIGIGASGNIFAQDPLFVNAADPDGADNIHRTADDGLALSACSPAIDKGLDTPTSGTGAIPALDMLGNAIYNSLKDMGAYERQSPKATPPTITLGPISSVSTTAASFSIPYIATTGSPDQYSLNTGTPAMSGFTAVSNVAFSGTSGTFNITIPTSTANTYNFNLTVRNSTTGCVSTAQTVALTVTAPCFSGNTLHVNASVVGVTGDGSSWANAYASLSDALAKAHTCSLIKTIKVAAGTYKPTKKPFNAGVEMTTTDGRDVTFHIPDGVTIEGGYNAATGNRDITANVTTLSGDIGTESSNDNAYHVVLASAATTGGVGVTIDGFSVTGGNGGSITSGSIVVNGNTINRYNGGGVLAYYGTNTLSNNTVYNNNSEAFSAGITLAYGTNTLNNNTVYSNSAAYDSGGIYTEGSTNMIRNNTLYNNTASSGSGGGIYASFSTNTISSNTIYSNTASRNGGGIYASSSTNTISNNTIYSNTAGSDGGGIYTLAGTNTLNNNIFWANKKGNDATVAGADYYAAGTNGNTFKNNLLQRAESNYPVLATGNYAIGTAATGNLFAQDPLFVNAADSDGADNKHRTADDGLALQSSSPAINKGLISTIIPETDITGATRTNPDMGAYEYIDPCPSGNTLYVNASVVGGTDDGSSWANAYASLSDALAKAHTCSLIKTIKVAAGTYKPTKKPFNAGVEMTTTDGRDVTFHIPDGVTIEGGYDATGSRNITANVTILSGDIGTESSNDNAYHVVLASAATTGGVGVTVDGFTIKGGNANGFSSITVNGNSIPGSNGGGIAILNGTNTLSNNTLYSNSANSGGGGGGGIYINAGTNTLSNNTLYSNSAFEGGGIYTIYGTNNMLSNNTLYSNSASFGGGGIYVNAGTNTLSNNTLYSNSASTGGGIYTVLGTNTLSNNTLSGNIAPTNGGGIYTFSSTNTLSNNIFWANKKDTDATVAGADYFAASTNRNTFKNNLLQLAASNYPESATGSYAIGTGASGNLFAQDPLFVNAADPDGADNIHRTADDGLALSGCSPAIDAGLNTPTSGTGAIPALDMLGNAIFNSLKDLGAYERQSAKDTPPSITLDNIAGVSTTATSFSIPFMATTGSPNQYSLVASPPTSMTTPMPNFTPVSNVAFSGTSGTFNIIIPASAAGTYNFNLTVRNSTTGCVSAVTPVALTVTATPTITLSTPPLTAFSACAGTASGQQSFTVSGSNLTNNITVTAPTGFQVRMQEREFGPSVTLTRSGSNVDLTTIYVRMASTATGTPSGNVTLSSTGATPRNVAVSGTVNALPNLQASTTTPSVCVGQSIRLTAGLVSPPAPDAPRTAAVTPIQVNYAWAGPVGSNYSSNNQEPTPFAASSTAFGGLYSVTVTSNGCTASATTSVAVNALPNLQASTTTPTVCVGQSISLTASLVSPPTSGTPSTAASNVSLVNYAWAGPSGYTTTTQNPSVTASSTAFGGRYSVTVTSNGCTASATTSVAVNAQPNLQAGTNNPSVCVGQSISLTAGLGSSLSAPNTPTTAANIIIISLDTYAWAGPSGYTTTIQNPSVTASSTAFGGRYSVTVTSGGCTASATTSVAVNALPNLQVSPPAPLCSGSDFNLNSAFSSNGTLEFFSDQAFSSTAANPVRAPGGTFYARATLNGCSATNSVNLSFGGGSATISVNSNSPVCNAATLNLSASGGNSYTWSGPGGYTSNQQNPTRASATAAMAGVYTVSLSTSTGCTASQTVSVVVSSPTNRPVISSIRVNGQLAPLKGSVSVPLGQPIQLSVSASNAVTYSWRSSSGFTSTLQNPLIASARASDAGVYIVVVRNGCQFFAAGSVTVSVNSATRLAAANDEATLGLDISLAPNPVREVLNVQVQGIEGESLQLGIHDAQGRSLQQVSIEAAEGKAQHRFDLRSLPTGLYLLQAESSSQRATKKVIKVD